MSSRSCRRMALSLVALSLVQSLYLVSQMKDVWRKLLYEEEWPNSIISTGSQSSLKLDIISFNISINETFIRSNTTTEPPTRVIVDQIHRSDLVYLPLLPWERQSLVDRTCKPPKGIPSYCCLGSLSAGGRVFFAETKCDKGRETYNFTEIAALQALVEHPVSEDNDNSIPRCDICRIVDLLQQKNWTMALQGDSITRQTFVGLECELRRRKYAVMSEEIFRVQVPKPNWRHGLDAVHELRIRKRGPGENNKPPAIIRYYGMYRPAPDMVEILQIANNNDLLIFDHGLHYGKASRNEFYEDMTVMLQAIMLNATRRVKLLAWRETSAQHFDTPGGHYHPNGPKDRCVPIEKEHVEGKHRLGRMMQQVMKDAGITEEDLKIFPFRSYTSQFHELKTEGDCSHFCSSPALWLPLWRMMRNAMDSIPTSIE